MLKIFLSSVTVEEHALQISKPHLGSKELHSRFKELPEFTDAMYMNLLL
jgi:hypothetical protein